MGPAVHDEGPQDHSGADGEGRSGLQPHKEEGSQALPRLPAIRTSRPLDMQGAMGASASVANHTAGSAAELEAMPVVYVFPALSLPAAAGVVIIAISAPFVLRAVRWTSPVVAVTAHTADPAQNQLLFPGWPTLSGSLHLLTGTAVLLACCWQLWCLYERQATSAPALLDTLDAGGRRAGMQDGGAPSPFLTCDSPITSHSARGLLQAMAGRQGAAAMQATEPATSPASRPGPANSPVRAALRSPSSFHSREILASGSPRAADPHGKKGLSVLTAPAHGSGGLWPPLPSLTSWIKPLVSLAGAPTGGSAAGSSTSPRSCTGTTEGSSGLAQAGVNSSGQQAVAGSQGYRANSGYPVSKQGGGDQGLYVVPEDPGAIGGVGSVEAGGVREGSSGSAAGVRVSPTLEQAMGLPGRASLEYGQPQALGSRSRAISGSGSAAAGGRDGACAPRTPTPGTPPVQGSGISTGIAPDQASPAPASLSGGEAGTMAAPGVQPLGGSSNSSSGHSSVASGSAAGGNESGGHGGAGTVAGADAPASGSSRAGSDGSFSIWSWALPGLHLLRRQTARERQARRQQQQQQGRDRHRRTSWLSTGNLSASVASPRRAWAGVWEPGSGIASQPDFTLSTLGTDPLGTMRTESGQGIGLLPVGSIISSPPASAPPTSTGLASGVVAAVLGSPVIRSLCGSSQPSVGSPSGASVVQQHGAGGSGAGLGRAAHMVASAAVSAARSMLGSPRGGASAATSPSYQQLQLHPQQQLVRNVSGGLDAGGVGSGQRSLLRHGSVAQKVSELIPRVVGAGWGTRSPSTASLSTLADTVGTGQQGGAGGSGSTPHALLLSTAEAVVGRKPAFSDLPQNAGRVQVLSVDDEPVNQQVMRALLWAAEYEVLEARNGEDALAMVRNGEVLPDIVLLDVTLGGAMSGFEVCREIRREHGPGELPIIMITCSSLEEDVIRGLALGANDYMIKPLRNLELMARIKTQLALKKSIKVASEARVNMSLLASILPANVIRQLKQGVTLIAQFHQEVTILFSDIRGFTTLATEWPTEQIILMLNNMFTAFDRLCDTLGVYKVETIGDAYMIVSGHDGVPDHAGRMLRMASSMLEAVADMRGYDGRELQIRVGIHTGPAHSGVVGLSRPRYCFFGDTVNTASRMESTGFPMAVQVSEATMQAVTSRPEWAAEFDFVACGPRDIKGKGIMRTYLLRTGLYENAMRELAASAQLQQAAAGAVQRRSAPAIPGGAETVRQSGNGGGDEAGFRASTAGGGGGYGAAGAGGHPAVSGVTPVSMLQPEVSMRQHHNHHNDPLPSPSDEHKYASYRYHHQHGLGSSGLTTMGLSMAVDSSLMMLGPNSKRPSHDLMGTFDPTINPLQQGQLAMANMSNSSAGTTYATAAAMGARRPPRSAAASARASFDIPTHGSQSSDAQHWGTVSGEANGAEPWLSTAAESTRGSAASYATDPRVTRGTAGSGASRESACTADPRVARAPTSTQGARMLQGMGSPRAAVEGVVNETQDPLPRLSDLGAGMAGSPRFQRVSVLEVSLHDGVPPAAVLAAAAALTGDIGRQDGDEGGSGAGGGNAEGGGSVHMTPPSCSFTVTAGAVSGSYDTPTLTGESFKAAMLTPEGARTIEGAVHASSPWTMAYELGAGSHGGGAGGRTAEVGSSMPMPTPNASGQHSCYMGPGSSAPSRADSMGVGWILPLPPGTVPSPGQRGRTPLSLPSPGVMVAGGRRRSTGTASVYQLSSARGSTQGYEKSSPGSTGTGYANTLEGWLHGPPGSSMGQLDLVAAEQLFGKPRPGDWALPLAQGSTGDGAQDRGPARHLPAVSEEGPPLSTDAPTHSHSPFSPAAAAAAGNAYSSGRSIGDHGSEENGRPGSASGGGGAAADSAAATRTIKASPPPTANPHASHLYNLTNNSMPNQNPSNVYRASHDLPASGRNSLALSGRPAPSPSPSTGITMGSGYASSLPDGQHTYMRAQRQESNASANEGAMTSEGLAPQLSSGLHTPRSGVSGQHQQGANTPVSTLSGAPTWPAVHGSPGVLSRGGSLSGNTAAMMAAARRSMGGGGTASREDSPQPMVGSGSGAAPSPRSTPTKQGPGESISSGGLASRGASRDGRPFGRRAFTTQGLITSGYQGSPYNASPAAPVSRSNQASPHGRVSLHGPTGHVLRAKSGMPSGLDDGGSVDSDFSALCGATLHSRTAGGAASRVNSRRNIGPGTLAPSAAHSTIHSNPAFLLNSNNSVGGISIISQGWSNLYDPASPRPRLADHYAQGQQPSGDLEPRHALTERVFSNPLSIHSSSHNWDPTGSAQLPLSPPPAHSVSGPGALGLHAARPITANTPERSNSSGLQRHGSGASPQRHAALHAGTPAHRAPSHAIGPWDSASDPQRQHQHQQQEQQRQQRAASGVADDKGLTSSSSAVLLSYSPPSSSRRRTPHYKSPMDDDCCSLTLGPVLNVAGALENLGPVPGTVGQMQQAHMHVQTQRSSGGAVESPLNSGGGSFKDSGNGTLARAMSADTGYLAAASAGGAAASHRNASSAGGAGSPSRRAPGKRASMLSREGRAAPAALPGQAAAGAWMAVQRGSESLATSGGGGDAGTLTSAATGSGAPLHAAANEVERSHASMLMELQREIYGSPDRPAVAGPRRQLFDGANSGSGGGGGGVQSGAALREYSKSLDLRRPYPYAYRYGQQPPIPPGASGAGLSVKAPASGSGVHAESMVSAGGLASAASGAASSSATVTAVAAAVLAAAEEGDGFSSALPGFEHLDEYSRKHSREWFGGGLSSLSSFGGLGGAAGAGAAPGSTPWASAGRAGRHSIDVHSLLALQQGVLSPDSPTRQQQQQHNVMLPQVLSQSQQSFPRHRVTLQHQPNSGIAGIPPGGLPAAPQQAMPAAPRPAYPPSCPTRMDRSASGPAAAAAAAAAAAGGAGAAGCGSDGSALRRAATQAGAQMPLPRSLSLTPNTSQTGHSSSGALSGTVSADMRSYAQQQMVQELQQQQPGPGGHLAIPRAFSAEPGAPPPSHQLLVASGLPLSYRRYSVDIAATSARAAALQGDSSSPFRNPLSASGGAAGVEVCRADEAAAALSAGGAVRARLMAMRQQQLQHQEAAMRQVHTIAAFGSPVGMMLDAHLRQQQQQQQGGARGGGAPPVGSNRSGSYGGTSSDAAAAGVEVGQMLLQARVAGVGSPRTTGMTGAAGGSGGGGSGTPALAHASRRSEEAFSSGGFAAPAMAHAARRSEEAFSGSGFAAGAAAAAAGAPASWGQVLADRPGGHELAHGHGDAPAAHAPAAAGDVAAHMHSWLSAAVPGAAAAAAAGATFGSSPQLSHPSRLEPVDEGGGSINDTVSVVNSFVGAMSSDAQPRQHESEHEQDLVGSEILSVSRYAAAGDQHSTSPLNALLSSPGSRNDTRGTGAGTATGSGEWEAGGSEAEGGVGEKGGKGKGKRMGAKLLSRMRNVLRSGVGGSKQ